MVENRDNIFQDEENFLKETEIVNKYLTFISDSLVYGIPVENVVEILTNPSITALPMVPYYVKGIINLRGQIVPIINMRQIMNKPENTDNAIVCVIILEIGAISIGILVDTVLQVIDVKGVIADPPRKGLDYVSGMTNLSDGTVMFSLDCDELVKQ